MISIFQLFFASIWNHLVTLTRKERITVIVTTHYIEEARQANVVGLMRQGRLLEENSPDQLMAQYNLDTLEDVFLKLCMSDLAIKASALSNFTSTLPSAATVNGGSGGIEYYSPTKEMATNVTTSTPATLNVPQPNQPMSTISASQYHQMATNGDLKNIIKVNRSQSSHPNRVLK